MHLSNTRLNFLSFESLYRFPEPVTVTSIYIHVHVFAVCSFGWECTFNFDLGKWKFSGQKLMLLKMYTYKYYVILNTTLHINGASLYLGTGHYLSPGGWGQNVNFEWANITDPPFFKFQLLQIFWLPPFLIIVERLLVLYVAINSF
jgi:hypothetical protein